MIRFPSSGDKNEWREWAKAYRDRLNVATAFDRIAPNLMRLDEWRNARRVLLYSATPSEINVDSLFGDGSDREWHLPRCAAGFRLAIHRVSSGARSELKQSGFGIFEPRRETPEVEPEDLDLVIVPALALSERGYRLGYGAGYYDRFLPRLRPGCVTIGLALDALVVPTLPTEPHDVPVRLIVTESRTIRPADTTGPIPPPYSG